MFQHMDVLNMNFRPRTMITYTIQKDEYRTARRSYKDHWTSGCLLLSWLEAPVMCWLTFRSKMTLSNVFPCLTEFLTTIWLFYFIFARRKFLRDGRESTESFMTIYAMVRKSQKKNSGRSDLASDHPGGRVVGYYIMHMYSVELTVE